MYRSNIANIKRAKLIKKSLGVLIAVRYLEIRGWSDEAIEYIMEQFHNLGGHHGQATSRK